MPTQPSPAVVARLGVDGAERRRRDIYNIVIIIIIIIIIIIHIRSRRLLWSRDSGSMALSGGGGINKLDDAVDPQTTFVYNWQVMHVIYHDLYIYIIVIHQ
jgi:hypothetical protein